MGRALVRRTRGTTDEREVLVHLTDQGHELRGRAQSVPAAISRATELSDADRDPLVGDLRRLATRLHSFSAS